MADRASTKQPVRNRHRRHPLQEPQTAQHKNTEHTQGYRDIVKIEGKPRKPATGIYQARTRVILLDGWNNQEIFFQPGPDQDLNGNQS